MAELTKFGHMYHHGLPMETRTGRSTFRDNLRALPAPAWILFGGTFVNRFGTFVVPFLVIYLTRRGYTVGDAGLAIAAYGAGHLCASLLGGHLADRIGRRNTIVLSMFAAGTSMLALSQASGLTAILPLTWFAGLSGELYRPAATALIGDLVPAGKRVAAFGMYRFAINLGFAAGPATAGFLAGHSFFYLFLGDALTSFAYGIIALLALPHGLRSDPTRERFGEAFVAASRDRAFVIFLFASVCITSVDFQMGSTFALHVKAQGLSNATYGMLISMNGVLIVLFELIITAWTQRFPVRSMIALGYALAGLGFALTGLAHNVPALAATVVIWTLGEMVSSPVTGAYVSGLAPEQYRGRYMGMWVLTWSLGMILGPTIGTRVYANNPNLVWIGCGVLGLIGAVLSLMNPRK
ncbi:MAG TPA: MFS transporter [Thermoanaerobaculia bacterium]|nr:MFS transporter [Thermoanaerobaculia bacterium]